MLPSSARADANVPVVFAPSVVGVKATTSSLAPLTPVTEKLPTVDRYKVGLPPVSRTYRPLTSSPSFEFSPTSLPSKYIAHVPAVVAPRLVGVKAIRSSSSPVTPPLTENVPVVEIRIRPSARTATASMFSFEPLRPTSLPSKYIDHVPAVLSPSDVGTKRSKSSPLPVIVAPPAPGTEKAPTVDITMLPSGRNTNASISSLVVVSPTSLPSNCIRYP